MLQERCFEPVGGTQTIQVDVRVIAATHQNLEQLIVQGRFREDLYYRLNVITIQMPPLRERTEDILELALHFLMHPPKSAANGSRISTPRLWRRSSGIAGQETCRELENVLERAVVLAESDRVTLADLPAEIVRPGRLPSQIIETKPSSRRQPAGFPEGPTVGSQSAEGTPGWEREALLGTAKVFGQQGPRGTPAGHPPQHLLQ